jgi:putative ABC transport system permease protein
MLGLTWLRGVVRHSGCLSATAAGIAIAVALLASIGTFLASSKATMTQRAAATVGVDWQVESQPGADPASVLSTTRSTPEVKAALPVGYGSTTGFTATTGGTTQTTGPGMVLGLPLDYRSIFPAELRDLTGARAGVLLAQQTAANLHAAPGDIVTVGRAGLAPVDVRIDGVIDLPQADSLFQKVGAPIGAQPQAPPDDVIIVPSGRWHELFDPLAQSRPDLVSTQIHTKLVHQLPGDPSTAYAHVSGAARNLEARLAGRGLVADNLGSTLSAARADALYAQVLFLFLGVPGAVLAGLLTVAVANSGAERRRREQALLRTRGASRRQLARLGLLEAGLVGGVGALAGLGIALVVGQVAFGTPSFGAGLSQAVGWSSAAALIGLGIAALAIGAPTWRDARVVSVAAARRPVGRAAQARWMRYGLDAILLVAALVVFWLTSRNGYQLVLAPEGTPSISVSYWALAGPALLWAGIGLAAYRGAFMVLRRARGAVARAARPISGPLAGTVAASMSRQRRLLARGVALVALTLSFAAATAVFNETYRAQSLVDARLTNGADVTVTEAPGSRVGPDAATRLEKVPGVTSVEPLQHRFAYVGADLQDLFGVRPSTIVDATKLQDAYFQGGGAGALIDRLARRPDSLLVSAETVKDFQLGVGDRVNLRLQDATTQRFKEVPFHYVGVVKEFPTAPKDSFFVANADYIRKQTGSDAVGALLIDTGGAPTSVVAARVRTAVGVGPTVTDIAMSRKVVGSSLTAVDLAGLTRVELGFALVLVAASTGLVLALGFAERRRTFAIAAALGARPRQLGGFVWSEATFVTFGGLAIGALAGWALAEMLVKILTGVFDPPPSALAVPWIYLGGLVTSAIVAELVAAIGAIRSSSRAPISVLREL